MKNKKKIYMMFFIIMFFVIMIGYTMIMPNAKEINEKTLNNNILEISKTKEVIDIKEVATFPWDKAYVIAPYMPKEEIAKRIGVSKLEISETVSEGMNHIIFMNEDKIECQLYSNAYNVGYLFEFDYEDFDKGILELKYSDIHDLEVKKEDDCVRLKYISKK